MSVTWDKAFINDFINSLLLTDTQGIDGIDCSRSKKKRGRNNVWQGVNNLQSRIIELKNRSEVLAWRKDKSENPKQE